MAEEEVVAPSASPLPSDCKRKFEDLDSEPTESNAKSNPDDNNADASVPDDGDNKRPRLGDDLETSANEQGSGEVAEPAESRDAPSEGQEVPAEDAHEKAEEPPKETEEPAKDLAEQDLPPGIRNRIQLIMLQRMWRFPLISKMLLLAEINLRLPLRPRHGELMFLTISFLDKIYYLCVKVGVLIGKAGDTIKYLQYNSGAKIQITRDAYADPQAATRSVEPIGSSESIYKAEKLISAVIAEADAGGSPALVASGLSPAQATMGSEQIQIQAPNEKVGLIIGRGGETIKGLQMKSGAYIQLIPQQLPEGDDSKERTVQVSNLVIKEVTGQIWLLPFPGVSITFLM
ncbi:hypothetical protein HN51_015241 [Arachis hypogaea]